MDDLRITLIVEKTKRLHALWVDEEINRIYTANGGAPLKTRATYRVKANGKVELVAINPSHDDLHLAAGLLEVD